MIYLKLKEPPKSVEETIRKLYKGTGSSASTYDDEECKEQQSYSGDFRSIDDIIEIVNTYFPNTENKEIYQAIFNIVFEIPASAFDQKHKLAFYIYDCDEIKRPTLNFCSSKLSDDSKFILEHEDSDYNWVNAWKECGFKDFKELNQHRNDLLKK